MTGSEILVIIIIVSIVLWVRSAIKKGWKNNYSAYPRMDEIRNAVAKHRRGIVYMDRISVDGIELVFKEHGYSNLTLDQTKDLAEYLASAMPVGTRYALVKKREESSWFPRRSSGLYTVVSNSTGTYAFEGTASDAPSRGQPIGWGFHATNKHVSGDGIRGEVEYHRSMGS